MVARVQRPIAVTVKEHIDDCIQHFAFEDALFLAEMNYEQEKSDETLLLLADCYYRTRRLHELFQLLHRNHLVSPRLRYIYALCCFELKKLDDCMRALGGTSPNRQNVLHPSFEHSTTAPFAYALLAKLHCQNKCDSAMEAACKSVRLNCLHWSTVQEYLYLGGSNPSDMFEPVLRQFQPHLKDENEELEFVDVEDENEVEDDDGEDDDDDEGGVAASHVTPIMIINSGVVGKRLLHQPAAPKKATRKSATEMTSSTSSSNAESRRSSLRSARNLRSDVENESTIKRPSIARAAKTSRTIESKSPKRRAEPKVPLASRNSNSLRSTSSTRAAVVRIPKAASAAATTRATPAARPPAAAAAAAAIPAYATRGSMTITPPGASTAAATCSCSRPTEKDAERMAAIVQRMSSLSLVHFNFANFHLAEAEKEIAAMQPESQDTSQVTLARARIMIERGEYRQARTLLECHHKRFPYKVDGMELLSTALWQEQDTHALSSLATTMTARARDRPESWCAAANSFSLAKQHSQAVQCLERAIKLDPSFVYSYTLLGWELIEMDELDKAAKAFMSALCVRPRDYRAYYGLGMVHQKKEQLHLASMDINKAIEINPQNCILYCAASSILHARGEIQAAIQMIDRALSIDPHSVAAHYHKARYLYDSRAYPECLTVLEKLKQRSSDEANVYFLLGKVYKRMGDTHSALLNFQWASNMDPRGESMMSDLGEHFEEEVSSS